MAPVSLLCEFLATFAVETDLNRKVRTNQDHAAVLDVAWRTTAPAGARPPFQLPLFNCCNLVNYFIGNSSVIK